MTAPQPIHGIDISHWQAGALDLEGAKRRGLQWMYHKATEGETVVDPNYDRRREEAKRAGLPFGAYHFARAGKTDARREALHFLRTAKPVVGDLRPALDIETDEGLSIAELRRWAEAWVNVVVKELEGVRPIVYTPYDLGEVLSDTLVWRPRYNNDNRQPVLPWDIWQFSNGVFGVPNRLAGVGKVDLNVMRKGLETKELLIPVRHVDPQAPLPVPFTQPQKQKIHVAHASLQFSDTGKQKRKDLQRLFRKARERNYAWFTGTEAGPGSGVLMKELPEIAKANGYRFFRPGATDSWVAVNEDFIDGGWSTHWDQVIAGKAKAYTAKGVGAVSFRNKKLGKITVIFCHLQTRGRKPGDPRYAQNVSLNRAIGAYARQAGKGGALVFYGGDQNIVDRFADTFMGAPLTSSWDELDKYHRTHPKAGNIDVIASYDKDGRVSAAYARALPDKRFHLHADHFLVETGFYVKELG